jgi:hypothetical protein
LTADYTYQPEANHHCEDDAISNAKHTDFAGKKAYVCNGKQVILQTHIIKCIRFYFPLPYRSVYTKNMKCYQQNMAIMVK